MEKNPENNESRLEEFAEHLAGCQVALLAYVFAMVQNMADAEDICQRASIVLWQKYDQFEPGTEFRSWAFKTARFEALNFIRKRRRERVYFSEETIQLIADMALMESENDSVWAGLRQCLEKLPEHHRQLIRLYYEGSETISRVGDKLGRSEIAVRSALCRVRKSLRSCIERIPTEEGA